MVLDPDREIGATHYLMMGAGEDHGVYSREDVEFSTGFQTREERAAANLHEWQRRIVERGPVGVTELVRSKTATVFGNGAFFWGGDNIWEITGQNEALLSLSGLHIEGDRVRVDLSCPWIWFACILWNVLLIGCVLCLCRRKPSRIELVIGVTLFFFCVYTLVFEVNPRYPLIFAPLFLTLGVLG